MTRMPLVLALAGMAVCLPAAGCSPASPRALPPEGTLVDLSHAFDAQTIFWPTSDPFRLEKVADGITAAGYYYAANSFFTSEHGGTHLDAPVHFAEGRQSVDRIPLDRFMGEAVIVDVTAASARDRDYQVTVEDIERTEREDGPIPGGAIVLFRTGFSQRWPDAEQYLGTAARGPDAVKDLHFPGLHPAAANWLLANRDIKAVGIDTASIDYGQSSLYESHRALFARDVPARGATVIALPMKIGGGSGAPLRAIAIVPDGGG